MFIMVSPLFQYIRTGHLIPGLGFGDLEARCMVADVWGRRCMGALGLKMTKPLDWGFCQGRRFIDTIMHAYYNSAKHHDIAR